MTYFYTKFSISADSFENSYQCKDSNKKSEIPSGQHKIFSSFGIKDAPPLSHPDAGQQDDGVEHQHQDKSEHVHDFSFFQLKLLFHFLILFSITNEKNTTARNCQLRQT